jgi:hypothetical protein
LKNTRTQDFAAANAAMAKKYPGWKQPADYTWHHIEHSNKLILIPTDIHNAVKHTGGVATNKALK